MKHFYSLFLLCLFVSPGRAQTVAWAVNTSTTGHFTRLATDRASNLYVFGYSEYYYPGLNDGSFLTKYSPNGDVLLRREWKGSFFISAVLNDGAGHFFFCGHFRDTIQSQGIYLRSQGNTDAFIGKMDESGQIEWTIGFGGPKNDFANDITFNSDSSEITIAGGVDSTVMLYDYPLVTTAKAIFVASFDRKGQIVHSKAYAFTPKEYGDNMGLEIKGSGDGGYFMLADRMGDHWSNEHPTGSPMEGRHVFSLDGKLNIKWSKFVISSACYYGYSCNGLSVQEGQPCIPSFCSGKYGGFGKLEKYDHISSAVTWSIANNDGYYYDTHASGKKLYYVGNEEANGCPCEDNNPGFARVKVLDELGHNQILLSKYEFYFYKVLKAPNGTIYVYGASWSGDPHLQGISLNQGYFVFAMREGSEPLSVPESEPSLLTVFPNPSEGYVEIVHNKIIQELTVLNASGAIVRQLRPDAKACTIRDLNQGYYLVRVKDADSQVTGKLLVGK